MSRAKTLKTVFFLTIIILAGYTNITNATNDSGCGCCPEGPSSPALYGNCLTGKTSTSHSLMSVWVTIFEAQGYTGLCNSFSPSGSSCWDYTVCCPAPYQNVCWQKNSKQSGCGGVCDAGPPAHYCTCYEPIELGACSVDCGSVIACINGDDCCPAGCVPSNDNDCTLGACTVYGQACTDSSQCCSHYCDTSIFDHWTCGEIVCRSHGQECTDNSQCCSNDCNTTTWTCDCTACPNPSTYCPNEAIFDDCGNTCPRGTKICAPDSPTNLNHSANTINTISWTWKKPASGTITKYQLFDSLGNLVKDSIPTSACSVSNCSWQETNLSTNTSYARYVKACNQTVCSDPSNTASAYTSIQPVATAQCTSITPYSIQITAYSAGGLGFSNLTSGSSGIRFRKTGVDTTQQSNTYVFAGLTPNTNYSFTAGPSQNGNGENTAGTASITCATQSVLPVPNSPANLHHTANTINTIDWAWTAPTGATFYEVYTYDGGFYRPLGQITNPFYTQSSYWSGSLADLLPNEMYSFAVSACNGSGCSGLSTASAATSILAPIDIGCDDIALDSMRVTTWPTTGTFPNLTTGSSGIVFREAGGATQNSQSTFWNLSGLIPETTYNFYAKARNQEGDLTTEFGPKTCSTLSPIINVSLRTYGPSGSILKLALINVEDALLLNRGTIKTRLPNGYDVAAYLVATSSPNASPVRVMTPMGIKAWRLGP